MELDGLLGDLGGGSLDLITLDKGQFGANGTLPLGHLRLPDAVGGDIQKAGPLVEEQFAHHEWLKDIRGRTLFAVGGSWRTLARIFIEQTHYPIHIIDGFTMGYSDLRHLCQVLSGLSGLSGCRGCRGVSGVSGLRISENMACIGSIVSDGSEVQLNGNC